MLHCIHELKWIGCHITDCSSFQKVTSSCIYPTLQLTNYDGYSNSLNFFALTLLFFHKNSSVFSLPEGRLLSYFSIVPNEHFLDVPNAALGFFYYTAVLLIEQFFYRKYGYGCIDFVSMPQITVAFNSAAMSSSIFLAIKLIQLKELCVLCWTTHLINSLLLVHYTRRMRSLQRNVVKEKEKSK